MLKFKNNQWSEVEDPFALSLGKEDDVAFEEAHFCKMDEVGLTDAPHTIEVWNHLEKNEWLIVFWCVDHGIHILVDSWQDYIDLMHKLAPIVMLPSFEKPRRT